MDEAGSIDAENHDVVQHKHVPQRTCIGCRRQDDQAVLLRLALADAGGVRAVVVDEHRRLPGRGAWMHRSPACMALALKRRAFNRSFRGAVDTQAVESWFHALGQAPARSASKNTVQPESGSEN
jgi:uncharacterized protein